MVIERTWKTVGEMLRGLPPQMKKNWSSTLGLLALAFNSRVHSTLKVSPYILVMGRRSHMPKDLLLPPPGQVVGNTQEDLEARFRAVFSFIREAKKSAYKIAAKQYTGKVRAFEPGDLVWFFGLDTKHAPISGKMLLNS